MTERETPPPAPAGWDVVTTPCSRCGTPTVSYQSQDGAQACSTDLHFCISDEEYRARRIELRLARIEQALGIPPA